MTTLERMDLRIRKLAAYTGLQPTVLDVGRNEFDELVEELGSMLRFDAGTAVIPTDQLEIAGVRIVCIESHKHPLYQY